VFKPAGVAVWVLWDVVVDPPLGVRAWHGVLAEGLWKGSA
jgi:hypothetical protein